MNYHARGKINDSQKFVTGDGNLPEVVQASSRDAEPGP